MIKQIYSNIDFSKSFELKNFRVHNISTANRVLLGAELGTLNKGLTVYDTDLDSIYMWNGSSWVTPGGVHTHTESDIIDLDKYTQSEVDTLLLSKSNTGHTHVSADITDFQTEVSSNIDVDNTKKLTNSLASTGIIFGGIITINADPTKIDISAGAGYIVDDTVVPATTSYISWGTLTAVTLTDLLTATSTDIATNSVGGVVQQRSFSNSELRSVIFLGGVDHSGGSINNVFSVQVPSFAATLSVRDLARAVGDLNLSGNSYNAASNDLTIAKSSGQAFSFGRNTISDKTNPHIINQSAISPVTFNYIFRDGLGGTTVSASTTNINPLNYDDGTGTLATVGVNDFAFHNILFFPNANKTFIQYGTTTYNTLTAAIDGLSTTTFPPLVGFTSAMRRGVLIVRRGTTDLSNPSLARFFVADKFGSIAGAIGTGVSSGGDMLASVYDPTNIASDVFDRANHTGTQTKSTISDFAHTHPQSEITDLVTDLGNKQDTLVSATNIKTINGNSILGAGDLVVGGSHTFVWAQLRCTDEARASWVSANNSEAQFTFEHAEGVSGITYTTSQITIDTTANYKLSYSVNGPLTAAAVINIRIKVDGTELNWLRGTDREGTLGYSVSISNSGILSLTAGQVVTLWFYSNVSCAFGGAAVLLVEKL